MAALFASHPKTEECTSAPLAHPFRHSCSGSGDPFGSEGDEANIANADLFRVPPSLVPSADGDGDGQIDKQLVN